MNSLDNSFEKSFAAGEGAAWSFSGPCPEVQISGSVYSRCVIIGAAPAPSGAELIRASDLVAVCDGGLKYALSKHIRFSLLTGDFDSFDGDLPEGGYRFVRLVPEKDDTDTEHAVKLLLAKGFRSFLMLGAAGGRTDHFLGNLALGRRIAMAGGNCVITGPAVSSTAGTAPCSPASPPMLYGIPAREIFFIFSGATLSLAPIPDAYVSIFPLSGALHGVTLSGFKYPAADQTFTGDNTLGVSNEFLPCSDAPAGPSAGARRFAQIRVNKGVALVSVLLKDSANG